MNTIIKRKKVKVYKEDTEQALNELTEGMMDVNTFYNLEVVEGREDERKNIILIG